MGKVMDFILRKQVVILVFLSIRYVQLLPTLFSGEYEASLKVARVAVVLTYTCICYLSYKNKSLFTWLFVLITSITGIMGLLVGYFMMARNVVIGVSSITLSVYFIIGSVVTASNEIRKGRGRERPFGRPPAGGTGSPEK